MRVAFRVVAVSVLLLGASKASAPAACTCVRRGLKAAEVRGRVIAVDKQGVEEPIPNATVKLLKCIEGDCRAISEVTVDEGGRFFIEGIRSGEYDIVASATHFERVWVKLKVSGRARSKGEIVFALGPGVDCCAGWAKVRKIK